MLQTSTLETVKSTVPTLEEHGIALTSLFYRNMFEKNPEVRAFFNPANQKAGRQQQALAGAITAFAKNVDNIEALASAVNLIAHKHASLMIKPEHYPIVGQNLLEAIQELLDIGPDHKIIVAWGEAYNFLANAMIQREEDIYKGSVAKTGGWEGFRDFEISKRVQESSLVTSFYLKPKDQKPIPEFLPGQYITVRVPTADGQTTMRNYSLSEKHDTEHFRISVKREEGNGGAVPAGVVSNYLHKLCDEGQTLELGPPCGEFTLNLAQGTPRPFVFLAGGIGITPLISMIKTIIEKGPDLPLTLVYACINKDVQAFHNDLNGLVDKHKNLTIHHRYADVSEACKETSNISQGFVDQAFLNNVLENRDANYYICGPGGFMTAMTNILDGWEIPQEQVRLEAFGPST